jgi:hypothetical protein
LNLRAGIPFTVVAVLPFLFANEVPRSINGAVFGVSEVLEEAPGEVEASIAASWALVDDLGDRALAVGVDLDLLAAMHTAAVLRRVEGDDEVGGPVLPAACAETVSIPRELSVIEAFGESGGRG